MQLIVLGMHRSGTSVLARALNLMGAYFGPEGVSTGANQENPKGFWERRDVRALNDAVLQGVGCDWNRVLHFDPSRLPPELQADFDERAARLLLELDAHRPWLLKEPRLCLLLPLWRKWLEAPVCIHISRHPVEVASSLHKRNGMPMEVGLLLWERYARAAMAGADGLPSLNVSHRELMHAPQTAVERLHAELERIGVRGLRMPGAREVAAFIEDGLYRERESSPGLQAYADAPQMALFHAIELGNGALPPESDMAPLAAFEAGLPPLKPTPMPEIFPSPARVAQQAALQVVERHSTKVEEERRALELRLVQAEAECNARETALQASEKHSAKAEEERIAMERKLAEEVERGKRLAAESAQWQARLETLAAQSAQADRERVALQARIEQQTIVANELESNKVAAEERAAASEGRAIEAERRAALALRDIARLTRRLLLRDLDFDALTTRHAEEASRHAQVRGKLATDAKVLRQQLAATERRAAEADRRLETLTGSFTWRAGRPARALARRVRGLLGRSGTPEHRLLRKSGMLDSQWYLGRYPDVAASGIDPVEHYLGFGAEEGRDPGPGFNTRRYLECNPDVAGSGMNALVHYLRYGREEGRKPC